MQVKARAGGTGAAQFLNHDQIKEDALANATIFLGQPGVEHAQLPRLAPKLFRHLMRLGPFGMVWANAVIAELANHVAELLVFILKKLSWHKGHVMRP